MAEVDITNIKDLGSIIKLIEQNANLKSGKNEFITILKYLQEHPNILGKSKIKAEDINSLKDKDGKINTDGLLTLLATNIDGNIPDKIIELIKNIRDKQNADEEAESLKKLYAEVSKVNEEASKAVGKIFEQYGKDKAELKEINPIENYDLSAAKKALYNDNADTAKSELAKFEEDIADELKNKIYSIQRDTETGEVKKQKIDSLIENYKTKINSFDISGGAKVRINNEIIDLVNSINETSSNIPDSLIHKFNKFKKANEETKDSLKIIPEGYLDYILYATYQFIVNILFDFQTTLQTIQVAQNNLEDLYLAILNGKVKDSSEIKEKIKIYSESIQKSIQQLSINRDHIYGKSSAEVMQAVAKYKNFLVDISKFNSINLKDNLINENKLTSLAKLSSLTGLKNVLKNNPDLFSVKLSLLKVLIDKSTKNLNIPNIANIKTENDLRNAMESLDINLKQDIHKLYNIIETICLNIEKKIPEEAISKTIKEYKILSESQQDFLSSVLITNTVKDITTGLTKENNKNLIEAGKMLGGVVHEMKHIAIEKKNKLIELQEDLIVALGVENNQIKEKINTLMLKYNIQNKDKVLEDIAKTGVLKNLKESIDFFTEDIKTHKSIDEILHDDKHHIDDFCGKLYEKIKPNIEKLSKEIDLEKDLENPKNALAWLEKMIKGGDKVQSADMHAFAENSWQEDKGQQKNHYNLPKEEIKIPAFKNLTY